jgi:hypothetical protein
MPCAGLGRIIRRMRTSYGIVWQEGTLPVATGRLELLSRGVRLEGLAGARSTERDLAYESLAGVRIGRSGAERLDGRPTLVLERRSGVPIRIASVAQSSLVAEIAERLAVLRLGPEAERRLAVVVPIKEGAQEAVRTLLEAGPPFDPEQTPLDRHQVFLTAHEVLFLFEAELGAQALEPLLEEPDLWKIAASWREHVAGAPRIAEDVYSWARPAVELEPRPA